MISEPLRHPLSMFDVRDKVAVITGASGTFGRAVALALTSLGGKVVLAAGSASELEEVAKEVRELGGDPLALLKRPDSVEAANEIRDAALKKFGRIDQLVIASGYNKAGFIQDQPLEEWQSIMDANVKGAWVMAKAVGSYWLQNKIKGKVLLMSSVRGRHGNISGYTGYCTSKGATDALTRVLATEWGKHGITVNAIAPTVFRSPLTAWMFEDNEKARTTRTGMLARIPVGRLGEPEDLAGPLLFLASRASDFYTGHILYADGGYTAG